MGTVVLLRHGASTWNREGRVQGLADARLTARGREQARAAGAHLATLAGELSPGNCSVTELAVDGETTAVVRRAETGFLDR